MDIINKLERKITFVNMISGLFVQLCTIISGFIVPRIVLSYFGSEVNGLVASLSQFLSYITLLEGGLASVMMAYLYKPLVEKDDRKTSSIVVSTQGFYNKIGLIFIVYSLCVGALYPLIFDLRFSFIYVFSLTIILSITYSIQYLLSFTLKTLLSADKRVYIINFSQALIVILNLVFVCVSVKIYPSIHLLKFISCSLFILQPIIYRSVVRRFYNIDWNAKGNKDLIKDRWSGFSINLAAFIHNSTDVTVLSFFSTLQNISVYSVYGLVTNGLKQLISTTVSGFTPVIGHAYAKGDIQDLNKKIDLYEYIVFVFVTFCFTLSALLITPFVMIYTKGINDADYYQPVFGVLISLAEALYLAKMPHLNLAYSANKFREITKPAYIEALINIIISIVLVWKIGIIGVAIGTVIAMTYRLAFHIWFTEKLIQRKQKIFYYKFFAFMTIAVIGYLVCNLLMPMTIFTIWNWIKYAVVYSVVLIIEILLISVLFYGEEIRYFKIYFSKRNKGK